MSILFLQFSTGFAQQNPAAEALGKPDSILLTAVNKGLAGDSIMSYSPATFPGGDQAFTFYLIRNLSMPPYFNQKIDTTILVSFMIDESGKLKDFHASDGPAPLRKEAIRVVKNSGRWIPAQRHGKPIVSERTQKISFKMNQ